MLEAVSSSGMMVMLMLKPMFELNISHTPSSVDLQTGLFRAVCVSSHSERGCMKGWVFRL